MKQPKTTEEFMALPVRDSLPVRVVVDPDGTQRHIPIRKKARAYCVEPDTVFYCAGYTLELDDQGFYRRVV